MGETARSYLTAEEARKRMLESQVLKNHIYREIRECANEGRNRTRWSFWDTDSEVRKSIIDDLKADGYVVTTDPMVDDESFDDTVIIAW